MLTKEVRQAVVTIIDCEDEILELQNEIAVNKEVLTKYFKASKEKQIVFERSMLNQTKEKRTYKAQVNERTTINYFQDKLKKKLDKEVYDIIIDKSYIVTNFSGLVRLMKEHGVDPAEFKRCISSVETLNRQKLTQAYNIGEITMVDLKDCYEAKVSKSIKVTRA